MNTNFTRLTLLMVVLAALSLFPACLGAEVALPHLAALGQPYVRQSQVIDFQSQQTLPSAIRVELNERKVAAIICEFADKETRFNAVKVQLQKALNLPPQTDSPTSTSWRKDRVDVTLTVDTRTGIVQITAGHPPQGK